LVGGEARVSTQKSLVKKRLNSEEEQAEKRRWSFVHDVGGLTVWMDKGKASFKNWRPAARERRKEDHEGSLKIDTKCVRRKKQEGGTTPKRGGNIFPEGFLEGGSMEKKRGKVWLQLSWVSPEGKRGLYRNWGGGTWAIIRREGTESGGCILSSNSRGRKRFSLKP